MRFILLCFFVGAATIGALIVDPANTCDRIIEGAAYLSHSSKSNGGEVEALSAVKPIGSLELATEISDIGGQEVIREALNQASLDLSNAYLRGTPKEQTEAEARREKLVAMLRANAKRISE
jgi:hypothetical protein